MTSLVDRLEIDTEKPVGKFVHDLDTVIKTISSKIPGSDYYIEGLLTAGNIYAGLAYLGLIAAPAYAPIFAVPGMIYLGRYSYVGLKRAYNGIKTYITQKGVQAKEYITNLLGAPKRIAYAAIENVKTKTSSFLKKLVPPIFYRNTATV